MSALRYHPLFLGILALLLTSACQKENKDPVFVHFVHEDFQRVVDTFAHFADVYGVVIDLNNLIIDYATDLDFLTCGLCNSHQPRPGQQREIKITENYSCWNYKQELEALILHELGHCYLGRLHEQDTLPNGDAKSLMISGDLAVYSPCIYVFGDAVDCNNLHKRSYYIEELFDPETPAPDWALAE